MPLAQTAMVAGVPANGLCEAVFIRPTMDEGRITTSCHLWKERDPLQTGSTPSRRIGPRGAAGGWAGDGAGEPDHARGALQCRMAYQALLLTGLPGSGKGTPGKILSALPGLHYWEAGEALRAIGPDSDIGRVIHQHLSRGELVPDELAVSLCLNDLEAHVTAGVYHPATDVLVLDGIPRTVRQATLLDEHVAVIKILHLVCNDIEPVVQRLRQRAAEQSRADDADECVVRHRLAVYQQDTAPVLAYYSAERIATIDALRSPAEVFDQILHLVIPLLMVIPLLNRRRAVPTDEP
jgi:adenylate kinase